MVAGGKKSRQNHNGGSRGVGGGGGGGGSRNRNHHVESSNDANNTHPSSSTSATADRREYDHRRDGNDDDEHDDDDFDRSLDFCQRFFGDVLYTNFNVALLFLIATILPILGWIPHLLIEYGAMGGKERRGGGTGNPALDASHSSSSSSRSERRVKQRRGNNMIHPHDVLAELGLRSHRATDAQGSSSSFGNYFDVVIDEGVDEYYHHADGSGVKYTLMRNPNYRGRSTMIEDGTTSSFPPSSDGDGSGGGGGVRSGRSGEGGERGGDGKDEGRGRRPPTRRNDDDPPSHPLPRRDRVSSVPPVLCPDGITLGFDNWFDLRDALSEANDNAAEDFLLLNEYLVAIGYDSRYADGNDGEYYGGGGNVASSYVPPKPFVICPGMTLNQYGGSYRGGGGGGGWLSPRAWATYLTSFLLPSSWSSSSSNTMSRRRRRRRRSRRGGDHGPIFVNAEDLVIECDMCAIDMAGTHLSFGPHARNVLIRGITFRGATTSSLTFHHHGADVRFEDCYWLYNSGGTVRHAAPQGQQPGGYDDAYGMGGTTTTTAGAVADLNSTSSVSFHRCVMDDVKQNPKRTTTGAGVANVPGMNPPAGHHGGMMMNQYGNGGGGGGGGVASSSLTIRN